MTIAFIRPGRIGLGIGVRRTVTSLGLALGGTIRTSGTVATFGRLTGASRRIMIAPSRFVIRLTLTINCLIFKTQYECSKNKLINTL